jgi:hypothetical protein
MAKYKHLFTKILNEEDTIVELQGVKNHTYIVWYEWSSEICFGKSMKQISSSLTWKEVVINAKHNK